MIERGWISWLGLEEKIWQSNSRKMAVGRFWNWLVIYRHGAKSRHGWVLPWCDFCVTVLFFEKCTKIVSRFLCRKAILVVEPNLKILSESVSRFVETWHDFLRSKFRDFDFKIVSRFELAWHDFEGRMKKFKITPKLYLLVNKSFEGIVVSQLSWQGLQLAFSKFFLPHKIKIFLYFLYWWQ